MSEVLMPSMSSMGMPSTTNRGLTPSAEKVEIPRTLTEADSPGWPEPAVMWTPATCPCMASKTLEAILRSMASSEREVTAPVMSRFFIVP